MAPRNRVSRLLNGNARTGSDIAPCSRLPVIPEAVREMFCDCNLPLPILLAIYQQGDAIEACFDDESKSMLELTPEPWPLIPLDGTDLVSTDRAFRVFEGCAGYACSRSPGTRLGPRLGADPARGVKIVMKTTHFGSNRSYGLSKAILVYSDGQEAFATVHEPKNSPDGGAALSRRRRTAHR